MYSVNAWRNEASPKRISLDKHSCRTEHTQRSAKAQTLTRVPKQGARLPQMWPGDTRYTISLHTQGKYHG
jgi:hypothetical protein